MRVNCPGCGHMIDLGRSYDDFTGQIRCYVCRTVTMIEAKDGKLLTAKPLSEGKECSDKERDRKR